MERVLSTEDVGLRPHGRAKRTYISGRPRDRVARRRTTAFVRAAFAVIAALSDAVTIVLIAALVGVAYHEEIYHSPGLGPVYASLGGVIAVLFVTYNLLRHDYALADYLNFAGHARRVFFVWNITCLTVLVFVFATKHTADYSRASLALIYIAGLVGLIGVRTALIYEVKTRAFVGKVSTLRIVIVGPETSLRTFSINHEPWTAGIDVVASSVLRGADTLVEDLALAAASARVLKPDDIFILLPWEETATIDACIAAFARVPAAVHLGPQPVLDRFANARISRIGKISTIHLIREPLTVVERALKRSFDLIGAAALLVCLTPVFCAIAILIKLESHGPIFFIQRRYGFNQEPFRILKFRSMNVTEDDRHLRQAQRDDPRVTRIGRFMRRYNIDELPQLLNVLRGEMSLVGPRPHALVHDQQYDRLIGDYARRHNVKPGITGWAQVHGLRGAIVSEDVMRARVVHDLYYIDNWTLGLDMRILVRTFFGKAFENAY